MVCILPDLRLLLVTTAACTKMAPFPSSWESRFSVSKLGKMKLLCPPHPHPCIRMECLKPGVRIYYFKNIHLSAEACMFLDSHHPLHPGFSVLLRVTVFCKVSPKKSEASPFFHRGDCPQPLGLGALPSEQRSCSPE